MLDGARTVRIKAIDRDGKPLAGVDFSPWLLHKEGRRSDVNLASGIFGSTTGPDGRRVRLAAGKQCGADILAEFESYSIVASN